MSLPRHVDSVHHLVLVGFTTLLLVLPGVATATAGATFAAVCAVGVLTLLVQLLQNLPLLMLFFLLGLGSIVFPPLAFVALAIAVLLIVARIRYVLSHAGVIAGGFAFYGLAIGFDLLWIPAFGSGRAALAPAIGPEAASLALTCLACVVLGGGLHLVLRPIYRAGYTPWQLFTVAMTAPAVILLLVLAALGIAADTVPDIVPELMPDAVPEPGAEPVAVAPPVRAVPEGPAIAAPSLSAAALPAEERPPRHSTRTG